MIKMKRKTMKRKCSYCRIIFSFKVKDLKLSKNQKRNIEYTTYTINCPFCYATKEVFINHTPYKVFNNILGIKGSELEFNILKSNPSILFEKVKEISEIVKFQLKNKKITYNNIRLVLLQNNYETKYERYVYLYLKTFNEYLVSNSRKSRIEMIKSTKINIKNNNAILDKIISKNIVNQLVSNDLHYNNKNLYYYTIFLFTILFISILIFF